MATCGWRREAPRAAGVARGAWRGRGAKPLAGARARRAAPGVGATAVGGLVGMIGTFIARSFVKDVDYWVPAAEVERIENEHRQHLIAQGLVKAEVKA